MIRTIHPKEFQAKFHGEFLRVKEEMLKLKGKTAPNPPVIALLQVNKPSQTFIFRTAKGGRPHAEYFLSRFISRKSLKNYSIFLSMEPCVSFPGKDSPPCTPLLESLSFKNLYILSRDFHPSVFGKGIAALNQKPGVYFCPLFEDRLSPSYDWKIYHTLKRPLVILKAATSMDGFISADKQKLLSSKKTKAWTLMRRQLYDAICISGRTLLLDKPRLTARKGRRQLKKLRPIIITKTFTKSHWKYLPDKKNALVLCERSEMRERSGPLFLLHSHPLSPAGLSTLLKTLYLGKITSLLVEGGGLIHKAFIEARYWDFFEVYVAPLVLGDQGRSIFLGGKRYDFRSHHLLESRSLEGDFFFRFQNSHPAAL